jgi:hypothetical protein
VMRKQINWLFIFETSSSYVARRGRDDEKRTHK